MTTSSGFDQGLWDYWGSPLENPTATDPSATGYSAPLDNGGTWNPWGSTQNVWNSSQNDGSVPWDVAMQNGLPPGAMYGAGGGSGSQSRLYANTGSDAYLNSALDRLRGTVTGQALPFDAATKANMLSKASDMNAAAEESNAGDVRNAVARGGGSLDDPSTQAALRQLKSTRQQGNMQAAQGIESQANLANFGAQQSAAGQLSSTRLQQAQVDPYYNGSPRVFTGTSWGAGGATAGGGTASGGTGGTTASNPNAGTYNDGAGGVPTIIDPNTGRPALGQPGFNSLIPPYIQTPNYGWQTGTQGVAAGGSTTWTPPKITSPAPKPTTTTTTQPAQNWQYLPSGSTISMNQSTAPGMAQSYQDYVNKQNSTASYPLY